MSTDINIIVEVSCCRNKRFHSIAWCRQAIKRVGDLGLFRKVTSSFRSTRLVRRFWIFVIFRRAVGFRHGRPTMRGRKTVGQYTRPPFLSQRIPAADDVNFGATPSRLVGSSILRIIIRTLRRQHPMRSRIPTFLFWWG